MERSHLRSCLRGLPKKVKEPLKGEMPDFWVLPEDRVSAQWTDRKGTFCPPAFGAAGLAQSSSDISNALVL